jgi:hypothetical protein
MSVVYVRPGDAHIADIRQSEPPKQPDLLPPHAEKTPAPQGTHYSSTTSAFNRCFLFFAAQRRDRISYPSTISPIVHERLALDD